MFAWLEKNLPKIAIAPSLVASLVFVYGFIAWTGYISFTKSRLLPKYDLIGTLQYERLANSPRWEVAFDNLLVFTSLFVIISIVLGLILAVFLDQKIRSEGFIRTIYLYPMALSMVVTGTAWKWIMNPGLGIENQLHQLGFTNAKFNWIVDSEWAIYAILIAAVWQSSGFVMALFLAGLRSINQEIILAAKIDNIPLSKIYWYIVFPTMTPVFLSSFIVLVHLSIKSFDLVVSMTGGGPGYSTDMPATYMYTMAFSRGNLGQAASSATVMMLMVFAIIVPYLYSELRKKHD